MGSYLEWEKYNEKRIEFIKTETIRSRNTVRIARTAMIATGISAVAAIANFCVNKQNISYQQLRYQQPKQIDTIVIKTIYPLKIDSLQIDIQDTVVIKDISKK